MESKKEAGVMSYQARVEQKIQSFERSEERTRLWKDICSAYEEGGLEQVKTRITEKADSFKSNYDELVQNLEQML